jgi:hypothetical protein
MPSFNMIEVSFVFLRKSKLFKRIHIIGLALIMSELVSVSPQDVQSMCHCIQDNDHVENEPKSMKIGIKWKFWTQYGTIENRAFAAIASVWKNFWDSHA